MLGCCGLVCKVDRDDGPVNSTAAIVIFIVASPFINARHYDENGICVLKTEIIRA
jgi:hypothetical protein